MASTPAVGPKPTTRTNTSAQINSGMLRSKIKVARTHQRNTAGQRSMRPDKVEIDNTLVASKLKGTANKSASVTPAVAMATVRQVSRTIICRNSASYTSGQKLRKKFLHQRLLRKQLLRLLFLLLLHRQLPLPLFLLLLHRQHLCLLHKQHLHRRLRLPRKRK